MNKVDRRERMLAELQTVGAIRIVEQAGLYNVTPETIRRDIEALSNEGRLVRTYGGAILSSIAHEPSANARINLNTTERQIIAIETADRVEHMNVIMVDGGSTTAFFASELARRYSNQPELTLTIITNSYDIARTLAPCPAVRVIVCPGDFDANENAVFGPRTSEFLMEFSADAAVFSAGGLSEVGVMDVNSMAACVKRSMIAQADKTLLIVDDRKFGIRQLERICDISSIDHLITNALPPKSLSATLTNANVQIHCACQDQPLRNFRTVSQKSSGTLDQYESPIPLK